MGLWNQWLTEIICLLDLVAEQNGKLPKNIAIMNIEVIILQITWFPLNSAIARITRIAETWICLSIFIKDFDGCIIPGKSGTGAATAGHVFLLRANQICPTRWQSGCQALDWPELSSVTPWWHDAKVAACPHRRNHEFNGHSDERSAIPTSMRTVIWYN